MILTFPIGRTPGYLSKATTLSKRKYHAYNNYYITNLIVLNSEQKGGIALLKSIEAGVHRGYQHHELTPEGPGA